MRPIWKKIILLITIAALLRIVIYSIYGPLIGHDSNEYLEMAGMFLSGNFSGFSGKITPQYPILLAMLSCNITLIIAFQMLLGISISILLYLLFRDISGSDTVGFFAGLSHAINPAAVFLERAILTETLAAFLILLSCCILFRASKSGKTVLGGLLLGIVSAMTALTKPLFLFMPVLCAILLAGQTILSSKGLYRQAILRAVFALLPAVVLIAGWNFINYRASGYYTTSTISGEALAMHVFSYFEKAPDKYAEIREIYIRHRDAKYSKLGKNAPITLKPARDEVKTKLGISYAELSRILQEISIYLIVKYPHKQFWR